MKLTGKQEVTLTIILPVVKAINHFYKDESE